MENSVEETIEIILELIGASVFVIMIGILTQAEPMRIIFERLVSVWN